jgi:hypothetical protein
MEVGVFQNQKIERLVAKCGWMGCAVWLYLLDRIYCNGYYYSWPDDEPEMIALKMSAGVTAELVREVVRMCCEVSLLDAEARAVSNVLTSRGIQRRYCMAAAERRHKEVIADYWLLKKSESAGFVKVALRGSFSPNNPSYSPNNPGFSPGKPPKVKESKVKEKEKKREGAKEKGERQPAFAPPSPEDVQAYCDERGNGIGGQRFCDWYAARGWMIGRARMKDWRAAVRTWERLDAEEGRAGRGGGGGAPRREKGYAQAGYDQREYDDGTYDQFVSYGFGGAKAPEARGAGSEGGSGDDKGKDRARG